ncbi:uncharacterized phosphotransferase YvkC [Plutella xylostella]|uniref:uncharacterized phosphotransferase YvkC n=1 Tax=Plutella xylostella TaxID=51655 RepID=UPI00203311BB|nr:uncharacterized phosphotransferase YvkC [Plutella xylostella]
MDFFDLLLQTGLITSLIVGYLILVKKAPTKKGFYSEHGWNYPLKYICALFAVKRWKKQRPTPASEELPSSKLTSGWQNLSVQATGTDGTTVVLGIRRWSERKQAAEVTVFVKLPDGETYTLPRHPDTVVGASEVTADSWSAGGLKIQVLQPRWALRVLFNGLLTRASDGKTLHARFSFIWRSASQPLHHPEGWSEQLASRALASEPWRDGQWIHMIDRWSDGSWHQWGALQGRFTTHTADGAEDTSVWLRARGVKDLSWAPHEYQALRRHVAVVLVAKDGTMVRLKGVSYKDVLTQVYYGDVRFPNYEVCPITSTDLSLPHYGEFVDGVPENSAISVSTSNGRTLRMVFRLEHAGGKLLSGSPTQYEVHYKTITGSIEGYAATGLLELGYVVKEPRVPSVRLTPPRSLKWLSKEDIKGAISYCAFFDTDPAKCPDLVGGKGASLALLAKKQRDLGYKVPPGYCITTLALDKQLKENPQLTKSISEIEASNEDYIEEVFKEKCNKASALIASTALVTEVKSEVLSHLKELRSKAIQENLGPALRFAVRSSAVGEDGEALSAAGQNDTILGCVTDDDVVGAVQRCWASMFAFTSAHYRRQNGQPCLCGGGVVVQALVTPTAAGVLFTRHPAAGDPARLLITANYGLGESVVSGAVEPDSITVARSERGEVSIAGIELGSKTHRVAAQGSGVTTEDVPENERNVACITDEQILQLAKMGVTQEELWGAPRDIEWAVTKDAIYLLQARPITSLERWSDEELLHEMDDPVMSDDALLSFANIGEVLPKPVSPLNIDLVMRPLQETMTEVVEKPPSVYKRYTIMTHYRGCMDLFNTIYRRVPPKIDVGMRMVEMAIHGHTVADADIHRTATHVHTRGRFDQVVLMYGMIESLVLSGWHASRARKAVKKLHFDLESEDPLQLLESVTGATVGLTPLYRHHMLTSSASTASQVIAMSVLLEGGQDFTPEQCNEVGKMLSSGQAVSAEVPHALARLSKQLNASDRAEDFRKVDPKQGLDWLKENIPQLHKDVVEFLDEHGHRAIMEFDIRTLPWVLAPEQLMEALQNMRVDTKHATSDVSDRDLIASLTTPTKSSTRTALSWILPLSRRMVINRESTKASLILGIHRLRLAVRRLGRALAAAWGLPHPDLVFYFRLYELETYLETRDPVLLRKAQLRRQHHAAWSRLSFAELHRGWPAPAPPAAPRLASAGASLRATPVCAGEVVARACVIKDLSEIHLLRQGDVLVTTCTDIGWSPYFPLISGIVTELGGLISHGAVIAREYGLPCIVGAAGATDLFQTGDLVRLAGASGTLDKVEATEEAVQASGEAVQASG